MEQRRVRDVEEFELGALLDEDEEDAEPADVEMFAPRPATARMN